MWPLKLIEKLLYKEKIFMYYGIQLEDYWINDLDENYAAQDRILKEIKKDLK